MAEEKQLKQARTTFNALCAVFDEKKWDYDKEEDKFLIKSGARGANTSIDIRIQVNPDRLLVTLVAPLHLTVPQERRKAMAVAVSCVNYGMADGSFDYDYSTGNIYLRLTSSFAGCLIGKRLFEFMIPYACFCVDNYAVKFLKVAQSDISFDEVVEFMEGNRG